MIVTISRQWENEDSNFLFFLERILNYKTLDAKEIFIHFNDEVFYHLNLITVTYFLSLILFLCVLENDFMIIRGF